MTESEFPDFATAQADLLKVVSAIHPKFHVEIPVPEDSPELAGATLSLLRAMVRQAELIIVVSEPGFAEEASANLRVIFEAWVNLIYLISQKGDSSAVAYRSFALLEFLDYLKASSLDEDDVADIEALVSELRTTFPDTVKTVEDQRAGNLKGKNKLYWSGLGPTALVRFAAESIAPIVQDESQLPRFYKFTSWDAHHVLTPVLNLDRDRFKAGFIKLGRRQPAEEAAAFSCFVASQMIKQAASLVMRRWPGLIDLKPTG